MGCTDPDNTNQWARHSMFIVPGDSPGLTQIRNLHVLGESHDGLGLNVVKDKS